MSTTTHSAPPATCSAESPRAAELFQQRLGALDVEQEPWTTRALCAQTDPEAFFPEKGGSNRAAKRTCLGCEVKDECLEYALAHDEQFGVWGGLSGRERRRLKKRTITSRRAWGTADVGSDNPERAR